MGLLSWGAGLLKRKNHATTGAQISHELRCRGLPEERIYGLGRGRERGGTEEFHDRRSISPIMSVFMYTPLLPVGTDTTEYDHVSSDYVTTLELDGRTFLKVQPEGLTLLAKRAFATVSYLLRAVHLQQLRAILDDPDASHNDQFVALEMLKNAVVAADRILPMCQDTGTAIISATRGEQVLTGGNDAEWLSKGIYETYQSGNLRYSQLAPLTMFQEQNTKTNLPAQVDIYAGKGAEYRFTFIQKGGGSANKTFLYQKTKAILNPDSLRAFIKEAIGELVHPHGPCPDPDVLNTSARRVLNVLCADQKHITHVPNAN